MPPSGVRKRCSAASHIRSTAPTTTALVFEGLQVLLARHHGFGRDEGPVRDLKGEPFARLARHDGPLADLDVVPHPDAEDDGALRALPRGPEVS